MRARVRASVRAGLRVRCYVVGGLDEGAMLVRVPVEGDHDEIEGLAHPVDDGHDRLRLVLVGERATDEVVLHLVGGRGQRLGVGLEVGVLHVDDDERALARHACWG